MVKMFFHFEVTFLWSKSTSREHFWRLRLELFRIWVYFSRSWRYSFTVESIIILKLITFLWSGTFQRIGPSLFNIVITFFQLSPRSLFFLFARDFYQDPLQKPQAQPHGNTFLTKIKALAIKIKATTPFSPKINPSVRINIYSFILKKVIELKEWGV